MQAHIPTLLLVIIVVSATLAALLGASAGRGARDGLGWWSAALALHAAAYVLFGLRDRISDLLSIVLANIMLASVFAMFAEGLFQFQRRPPPRRLLWAPVALVALVFWALIDDFPRRTIAGGAIYGAQSFILLAIVYQGRHVVSGRGHMFVAAALAPFTLLFFSRAVVAVTGSEAMPSLMTTGVTQSASFLISIICLIAMSVGVVVMSKERADQRNHMLAFEDELTGLPNRRAVLDALEQQLAQARRSRQEMSLLMLDIDHFKRVNDRHGHLVGDQVLRAVARRIQVRMRGQDVVGRVGGEEFLLILPNTSAEGGRQVAESLREGIAMEPVTTDDGRKLAVTVSIGVYGGEPLPGAEPDDLIRGADEMLYRAKNAGRNRVEAATS